MSNKKKEINIVSIFCYVLAVVFAICFIMAAVDLGSSNKAISDANSTIVSATSAMHQIEENYPEETYNDSLTEIGGKYDTYKKDKANSEKEIEKAGDTGQKTLVLVLLGGATLLSLAVAIAAPFIKEKNSPKNRK